jgi:hypothetical protein
MVTLAPLHPWSFGSLALRRRRWQPKMKLPQANNMPPELKAKSDAPRLSSLGAVEVKQLD